MKIVPLGANVVVRPIDADLITPGGIVLPDTAKEQPQQGRVLSVGDGQQLADGSCATPQVHEGDRVLFRRFGGSEVSVDGHELLILSEDEIFAIVR